MLMRWSDFDRSLAAMERFRRHMDRLVDDHNHTVDGDRLDRWFDPGTDWPRIDLRDEGPAIHLCAEVPGLSDKDISLTLNQDVLTLSGERKVTPPEGHAAHRQERLSYRFSRSFTLPCAVDPEDTAATVKDGILTVRLRKAPEAQPRRIAVKAS